MSLSQSIIFTLCTDIIIFYNLPSLCGADPEGYSKHALREILTPSESLNYILFNRLPSDVTFNAHEQAYYVKGNNRKANSGALSMMPNWENLLGMVPGGANSGTVADLIKGHDVMSHLKTLVPTSAAGAEGAAEKAGDIPIEKAGADAVEEAKDEALEIAGEDAGAQSRSYFDMAKDVYDSDLGQLAIKTGAGFVPGGPAALTFFESGKKMYDSYQRAQKAEKTVSKIPGI